MARTVKAYTVGRTKDGTTRTFAPGDEVPDEFADSLTNPAVWGEEAEQGDGYDDRSIDQLKDLLRGRELPVSGNKDELVARLRESDAEG